MSLFKKLERDFEEEPKWLQRYLEKDIKRGIRIFGLCAALSAAGTAYFVDYVDNHKTENKEETVPGTFCYSLLLGRIAGKDYYRQRKIIN